MSQTYTPVATSHGSFTLPSDGDPAVAESVNDAFRDLADNALVALNTSASALAIANQAINGTTGGSYAPAAKIILTTSGIQLSGVGADLVLTGQSTIQVSGSLFVSTSSVLVPGPLSILGNTFVVASSTQTTFNGNVVIDTLVAGHFDAHGNIGLGNSPSDTMVVEATSTFESPVTFNGPIIVDQMVVGHVDARGNIILGNNVSDTIAIKGTVNLQSPFGYSGAGRLPYRAPVSLPAGGATITVLDGDVFIVPINATGNYSASTTGAQNGDRMRFFCTGGMGSSRTINAGSATHVFSATKTTFSELIFSSGGWRLALYTAF